MKVRSLDCRPLTLVVIQRGIANEGRDLGGELYMDGRLTHP